MLEALTFGLLVILLGLGAALYRVAARPREGPHTPAPTPVAGSVTHDDVAAALAPFRDRIGVLEGAVERLNGQVGRFTQLTSRERRDAERSQLAEAVATQAAALRNGAASEGAQAETAPRSRFIRRYG